MAGEVVPSSRPQPLSSPLPQSTPSTAGRSMGDDGLLLCVMTVEIGDGRMGTVFIRQGDDPETLAEAFVSAYGLEVEVTPALTDHIAANRDVALARLAEVSVSQDASIAGREGTPAAVPPSVHPVSPSPLATPSRAPPTALTAAASSPSTVSTIPPFDNHGILASPSRLPATAVEPATAGRDAGDDDADAGHRSPVAGDQGGDDDEEAAYEALAQQYAGRKGKGSNVPRRGVGSGLLTPASAAGSRSDRGFGGSVSSGAAVPAAVPATTTAHTRKPVLSTRLVAHTAASAGHASVPVPGVGPQPPPAPPVKRVDPALFSRLHSEAEAHRARLKEQADKAAREEEEALRREARRALAVGKARAPGVSDSGLVSREGGIARLYETKKDVAERHATRTAQLKAASEEAAGWECPMCGGHNHGSMDTCMTVVKFGKLLQEASKVVTAVPGLGGHGATFHAPLIGVDGGHVRVCGAPRPPAFKPVISTFAAALTRNEDRDTRLAQQLEKYLAERRRREDKAAEAAEAEVAECAFKPAVNPRSMALVERKERGRVEPASSRHDQLYADAKKREVALEAARAAATQGCTFKPDIGANALRPTKEKNSDEFFERLYKQGAAARVRAEAVARRVMQATTAPPLAGGATHHHGLALYDAALASKAARQRSEVESALRIQRAANQKHTSAGSERLLVNMRRRALAAIFNLLVQSMSLTPAQRAQEVEDQAELDAALAEVEGGDRAGLAGGRGVDVDAGTGLPRLSAVELADLIAAVDAHGTGVADVVDRGHYDTVVTDAAVESAITTMLDVDAAWTGVLQPALAACCDLAFKRLRAGGVGGPSTGKPLLSGPSATPFPAPSIVTFPTFCAALGGVLEEVGGGPHVYMLAKRAATARVAPSRSLSRGSGGSSEKRGKLMPRGRGDAQHSPARGEPSPDATFHPVINPRSRAIATEMERREVLSSGGGVDAGGHVMPGVAAPPPVHERLMRKADEYAERRRVAEVEAARREMVMHPFKPQPQGVPPPPPPPVASGPMPMPVVHVSMRLPATTTVRPRPVPSATSMATGMTAPVHAPTAAAAAVGALAPVDPTLASHQALVDQVQELRRRNADLAERAHNVLMSTAATMPATTITTTTVSLAPATAVMTSPTRMFTTTGAASITSGVGAGPDAMYGYTPAPSTGGGEPRSQPRIASAAGRGPAPGTAASGGRLTGVAALPPVEGISAGGEGDILPGSLTSRLASMSMRDLEARIDRLLAVDPATEAKSRTAAKKAGRGVLVASTAGPTASSGGVGAAHLAGSTVKALDMRG